MSDVLKTLVVLGARGDMTGRLLLPALVRLAGSGALPPDTAILAVDRDAGDDEAYREHARQKLDAHLPDRDEKASDALLEHVRYRQADVTSADALRAALRGAAEPMAVYLALPNVLFRRRSRRWPGRTCRHTRHWSSRSRSAPTSTTRRRSTS